jgi:hypothetical protein
MIFVCIAICRDSVEKDVELKCGGRPHGHGFCRGKTRVACGERVGGVDVGERSPILVELDHARRFGG